MTDFRRIARENSRLVWALAAGLIINAALYALVVFPLARRVEAERHQAADAVRALNSARRSFDAAKGTVTGKKRADEELQAFYREVLPANLSAARRILFPHVEQLARKANLASEGLRFEPPTAKEGLARLGIRLTLAGEYADIRRFIYDIETAPEFIVLESVVVTQGNEGDRVLDVVAQVATYYRAEANGN